MNVRVRPPGPMPVAWEQAKARDARGMAASHEAALAAEKKRAEAKRQAEEPRRAEQKAARARAAKGGSPAQNRALGMQMCADRGWSSSQCSDLGRLWQKESGWNHRAHNSSGAHGIPQALPGSKMSSAGPNWEDNAETQIRWGLGYIKGRYGSACAAWSYKQGAGWY